MKFKKWKLRTISILILVIIGDFIAGASITNGCQLKYRKHVEEKPHLLIMTNTLPGICRIHNEENSTANYHVDRKYPERMFPESVIGGLNYDARNGTVFYWAKSANVDHSRLYKVRLNDSQWEPILDQDDDFRDVTYDWVSKNLYTIMGPRSLIVAVNAEHPWSPTVIVDGRAQLTSLAVHPNRGYLFFVEVSYWQGIRNKIYRAHLDGTSAVELNRTGAEARHYVGSLVVDPHGERLYWSVPGLDKIQHSDLEGADVRTISGARVYSGQLDLSSRTLAADKHYVYYRSSDANAIRRFEKTSGAKDEEYELRNDEAAPITEILAHAHRAQRVRKDHPCKLNRGGCEKYCFAVPDGEALRRVCKCSYNEMLAPDGEQCFNRRQVVV